MDFAFSYSVINFSLGIKRLMANASPLECLHGIYAEGKAPEQGLCRDIRTFKGITQIYL